MKRQIEKMLASSTDPRRQTREAAADLPWVMPVFAVSFAIGKLSRVVKLCDGMIKLVGVNKGDLAEELRESAHYLLQAAKLLESESGKRRGHYVI